MKVKLLIIVFIFFYIIFSCNHDNNTGNNNDLTDVLYHYSLMDAMRNGLYKGDITIENILKNKGDFGLGTLNLLFGELIVLEGKAYWVLPRGEVKEIKNEEKIPFGAFTFFNEDIRVVTENLMNEDSIKKNIFKNLPSLNRFYAIKLRGTFTNIVLGGSDKVEENESRPIAEILKTRPIYHANNIKGTIVGFYYPPYMSSVDLVPFHFHFISDDKKVGGHVLNANVDKGAVIYIDTKNSIDIQLPENKIYDKQWNNITNGNKDTY